SAPSTTVQLCVRNVNRRTGAGDSLLPGDSWTFRLDGGGTFSSLTQCVRDISVSSASVLASDLACAVAPEAVVLTYVGAPQPLAFEESFCIDVDFAPGSGAVVLDYRFRPRQTAFGPYSAEGLGRVNQPAGVSSFTL